MIVCKTSTKKDSKPKESSKQKSTDGNGRESSHHHHSGKSTKKVNGNSDKKKPVMKHKSSKCPHTKSSSSKSKSVKTSQPSKKVLIETKLKHLRGTAVNGWIKKRTSSSESSSSSTSSSSSNSSATASSKHASNSHHGKKHGATGSHTGTNSVSKGLCLFCNKPPSVGSQESPTKVKTKASAKHCNSSSNTKRSSTNEKGDEPSAKKVKKHTRDSKKVKALEFLRKKTTTQPPAVSYKLNPTQGVKRTMHFAEKTISTTNSSRVYRIASLNALAKVHILYENDMRNVGSDSSDGDSGSQFTETNNSRRSLPQESESMSRHPAASKETKKSKSSKQGEKLNAVSLGKKMAAKSKPEQQHKAPTNKVVSKPTKKKKAKLKIIPRKRKLEQVEIIDTRSCKRMASLNAQAIMAASLITERNRPKERTRSTDDPKPETTIVRVTMEKEEEKIEHERHVQDERSTIKKVSSKVKENIQVRAQHSQSASSDPTGHEHDDITHTKMKIHPKSKHTEVQSMTDTHPNCQLRSLTSSTSESTRTVASKVGLTTEYREVTKVHINTTKEMEVKEEGQPAERILEKDDVAITRMYHYQTKATSQSYCLQMHTSYKPAVSNEAYSPPPPQGQQQVSPPIIQPVMAHNNQNYYNYPAAHSNILPNSQSYPMPHGIGEVTNAMPILSVGPIPRHYGSAFSVPHYGHPPTAMPYAHGDYGFYQPSGAILQPIHDPCLIHKPVPFHPQQHPHPHSHHMHAQPPPPRNTYAPGDPCIPRHLPKQAPPCQVDPQTPRYPAEALQRNSSRQSSQFPSHNVAPAVYHCQSQPYPSPVSGFSKECPPGFQMEGHQDGAGPPPSQKLTPESVPTTVPKSEPVTPPEPVPLPNPHQTVVPLGPSLSTREPNVLVTERSRQVHHALHKGMSKQAVCQPLSTSSCASTAVKRSRSLQGSASEAELEKRTQKSARSLKFQNSSSNNNSSNNTNNGSNNTSNMSSKKTSNKSVSSMKSNNEVPKKSSSLVGNKKKRLKTDGKMRKTVPSPSSSSNSSSPQPSLVNQQVVAPKKCLQPKVAIQRLLLPKRKRLCVGWTWEGKPQDKLVFLSNDDPPCVRPCYPAMRHAEGDVIRVRDCVLLKSGPRKTDLPFVAKVAALWENPEDNEMMMSLLWYYRPEHTDQGRLPYQREDELFASKHRDVNSVACIEDKCYVLTFAEYCRYRGKVRMLDEGYVRLQPSVVPEPEEFYPRRERLPPGRMAPEMVFFCRKVYDFRQKRILKNPT